MAMHADPAMQRTSSPAQRHVRPARVLVVDDEADVRESVAAFVEATFGVAVDVAADAEQARRMLEGQPYALLLTDHRMPGVSGAELAAWVRATRPLTQVVMMTAYETPDWAPLGTEVPVLAKPFTSRELHDTLAARLSDTSSGETF